MFFSLNKVIVLILILVAVWYGFKLISRLDEARRNKQRAQVHGGRGNPTRHGSPAIRSIWSRARTENLSWRERDR